MSPTYFRNIAHDLRDTLCSIYIWQCILAILRMIFHDQHLDVHKHFTKKSYDFFLPRIRLENAAERFPVTGITLFNNKVPLNVKTLTLKEI